MRKPLQNAFLVASWCIVLSLAGGCRLFTSYPSSIRSCRKAFSDGAYARAAERMEGEKKSAGADALLYEMELGVYYRAAGDPENSRKNLLSAVQTIRERDERAAVSVRDTAYLAGTLMINDKAAPYDPPPYERILIHTYLCLDYLFKGDLENARVEVRQAHEAQKDARERYESEIAHTRSQATKRGADLSAIDSKVAAAYSKHASILSEAGNLYENLFNDYLSSIVYELNGEQNDAYIDAKTIYSQYPEFDYVHRDLLRFSRSMGAGEYEGWRDKFGVAADVPIPLDAGEIVLLYECGLAPIKKEFRLTLPFPINNHINLLTIAIPIFRLSRNPVDHARIVLDGREAAETQPLMNVEAAAIRSLRDRAPGIAIRHLIRQAAKIIALEQLRRSSGDLPYLLGLLFSTITEQADLRSWTSLPQSYQALRVPATAGTYDVEVRLMGRGAVVGRMIVTGVTVKQGHLTLISLRSVGIHGTASVISY